MAKTKRKAPAVTLPAGFIECEQGNVYLDSAEGDNHVAWIKLDGNVRLEITINPDSYPAVYVNTVVLSDKELADHILKNLGGWYARKMNLNDARLDKLKLGDQIPDDEEI